MEGVTGVGVAEAAAALEFTGPDGPLRTLSERTRKRLLDLGITEFFAGTFFLSTSASYILSQSTCLVQIALLPMLLPDNKLSRALYNPYFPQRDICASAPTGSGKTLAYVIPIVEVSGIIQIFHLLSVYLLSPRHCRLGL